MNSTLDQAPASLLIVDRDIVSRHAISEYLRDCGFSVLDAARIDEAYLALSESSLSIDAVFVAVVENDAPEIFEFAKWARSERPDLHVKLAGRFEGAVGTGADLCDSGLHLKQPYESERVLDYIKLMRAKQNYGGWSEGAKHDKTGRN